MSAVLQIVEKTKVCSKCEQNKYLSEFYKRKEGRLGRSSECKECWKETCRMARSNHTLDKTLQSERNRKWRESQMADPAKHERMKERKNNWNRTPKYYDMYYGKRFGISYKDVLSLLANQNGLCANIGCSKEIVVPPAEGDRACVDHSHETGKVRALLCVRCNTTLGHIENNKNLIPGLMDYLNKHR